MILNYFNNPTILVISAIIMIMALIFHNIFQAWVASRFGDNGPRFSGFMNFEPQQHLEPYGVFFLFLLGFGWPKAIPTSSRSYRGKQEALVWYSGPLAYLIVAFLSVLIGSVILTAGGSVELYRAFMVAASFAILHAVINLFPVFPLDGAKAALAWGNPEVRRVIQQIASYGFWGFIIIFLVLSFTGITGGLQAFFLRLLQLLVGLIPGL